MGAKHIGYALVERVEWRLELCAGEVERPNSLFEMAERHDHEM